MLPNHVRIVEVGARDGLQNEKAVIPTPVKIELIDRLTACGLETIEATSFVHPRLVPQMADAEAVAAGLPRGDVSWIGRPIPSRWFGSTTTRTPCRCSMPIASCSW